MKNILITGIRGFIGFNAIQLWKKLYPEYNYIGLDAETYADKFLIEDKNKYLAESKIIHYSVDISKDLDILENIITDNKIDTIVNFAAESHVDNSIKNPNIFFQSNIIGTANLLNLAKKYDLRFHQIGTDEVYGETTPIDWISGITLDGEQVIKNAVDKSLIPSSPYSSSKASADMIALSYYRTFGVKVTVSRCTNNAGPWQMSEKLIPTVISKAFYNQNIPVYGKGNQKRHWIHVDDHNKFIMNILKDGQYGKIYNIGPTKENWITNIALIEFILEYLRKPMSLIEHIKDRLGHDVSYYLPSSDNSFKTQLYKDFIPSIIDWYVDQFKNNKISI